MIEFSSEIYKLGINPVVDPPEMILNSVFKSARRSKGPIPVRGTINGVDFNQTLVKYQGAWRLYVNGEMLAACGLKVGDTAKFEIEFDPSPRKFPMPPALAAALANDDTAKIAFGHLSSSRQKEIFRYIGSLKTEVSISRNVERLLRELKGEAVKPLAAARKAKNS